MCDIHTKKSGTVPLRKEAKRCGSPQKIRVTYKKKETVRRFIVDESALQINTCGTVPQTKQKQVKVKRGSKFS